MKRTLPVVDAYGRSAISPFIDGEVERGAWTPLIVPPDVSGISRPMTIFLAEKPSGGMIKWSWHGDAETFCPPVWADLAIGSGACGFGCRSCFLMLTFRAMRDPLRPVVYTNGDDFEYQVRRWLRASTWGVDYDEVDVASGKRIKTKKMRARTRKDAIGLGIDCADSLLWEGVTGHARRLIPLFTDPRTNPLGNPLVLLTKSANTHYLAELTDVALRRINGNVPNVAVTMSLNPEAVADLWEGKFPDTRERITPPISTQLDTFRAWWGLPPMEFEPNVGDDREGTHRHVVDRGRTYTAVAEMVSRAFSRTGHAPWISLCKETHEVRKATGLCSGNCNCLQASEAPSWRRSLPIAATGGSSR